MSILESKKKIQYEMFASEYQKYIQEIEYKIKQFQKKISNYKDVESRYTIIAITSYYIQIIEYYFQINNQYVILFNQSSKSILDKIRKELSIVINLLDKSFGTKIMPKLTENSSILSKLSLLTPKRILNLLKKLEYLCDKLKNLYSIKSKYFSNTLTLYGKFAGFGTQLTNFKEFSTRSKDLQDPEYEEIRDLLIFIKQFIENSAELYIEGYSITKSPHFVEDGVKYLEFLELLIKFYPSYNNNEEILSNIKRKQESWKRLLIS